MRTLREFLRPAATAITLTVALAAGSTPALSSGEARDENSPIAEATITDPQWDTILVHHSQTPSQHIVCAAPHGTTDVVVKYDDNDMTLSPGHCALLEASQISAHAAGNGQSRVTVHTP